MRGFHIFLGFLVQFDFICCHQNLSHAFLEKSRWSAVLTIMTLRKNVFSAECSLYDVPLLLLGAIFGTA